MILKSNSQDYIEITNNYISIVQFTETPIDINMISHNETQIAYRMKNFTIDEHDAILNFIENIVNSCFLLTEKQDGPYGFYYSYNNTLFFASFMMKDDNYRMQLNAPETINDIHVIISSDQMKILSSFITGNELPTEITTVTDFWETVKVTEDETITFWNTHIEFHIDNQFYNKWNNVTTLLDISQRTLINSAIILATDDIDDHIMFIVPLSDEIIMYIHRYDEEKQSMRFLFTFEEHMGEYIYSRSMIVEIDKLTVVRIANILALTN